MWFEGPGQDRLCNFQLYGLEVDGTAQEGGDDARIKYLDSEAKVEELKSFVRGIEYQSPATRLKFIRKQLHLCLNDAPHVECRSKEDPRFKPPRLLDVSAKEVIRLVAGQTVNPKERYATASYAWGPNPTHIVLTSDNLFSFEQGITINLLPNTLLDIVRVTWRIGLKYVWIDGLCIVQKGPGSAEDWAAHVNLMADIYNHGALCIAAQTAKDCNHPLNMARLKCDTPPSVKVRLGSHGTDVELFLSLNEPYTSRLTADCGDLLEPLNERAWVMQERLLAPRLVEVVDGEVFWTCAAGNASFTHPRIEPRSTENRLRSLKNRQLDAVMPTDYPGWLDIVKLYISRRLTYNKDRLPALAGIARRTAALLGEEYVAGFFRSKLPHCLLWQVGSNAGKSFERIPGQPSWSWASMDTKGIEIHTDTLNLGLSSGDPETYPLTAVVKSVDIVLENPNDPFGAIVSGLIVLEGPFVELEDKSILSGARVSTACVMGESCASEITWDIPFMEQESLDIGSLCALLITVKEWDGRENCHLCGLMVVPVNNTNSFKRIGMFRCWDASRNSDFRGIFREVKIV